MRLSVIVPAYNEEERLEPMLRAYASALHAEDELIVVVNGSTDQTADVARRVAVDHPSIQVMEIREKIGKGGAVRAGFQRSTGALVGFADADGAIASRWAPGAKVYGRTALRTLASRVFATLVHVMFGLPFADTQCGAKVFTRRFLPTYLATSTVNDLAFDVELLLILHRAGARIVEVPSVWTAVPGSSTLASPTGLLRNGWRMFQSLLRLRRGSRRWVFAPVAR